VASGFFVGTESTFRRRAETNPSEALARAKLAKLPRAADRAIARQRARTHAEARRQRRRHVVQRSAAIAAMVQPGALDSEPVPARRALRIQTLHRPTGQILHFRWPRKNHSSGSGRENSAAERPVLLKRQDCGDCEPEALVSQGKCIQLVGVGFQVVKKPNARFGNTESRVAMRLDF